MATVGYDIGGYVPVGYEVTPWTALFPDLVPNGRSRTLSNAYQAKLYTYYLTRVHFSQYLSFVCDTGLGENDSLADDVAWYESRSDDLLTSINRAKPPITGDFVDKTIIAFETNVRTAPHFYSIAVYREFFEHYDFYTSCAYGFITAHFWPNTTSGFYLSDPAGWIPTPSNPFNLAEMMSDAIRIYPVIVRSADKIRMAAFQGGWRDAFELYQMYASVMPGPLNNPSDARLFGALWGNGLDWRSFTDGLKLHSDGDLRYCNLAPVQDRDPLQVFDGWRWYPVGLDDLPADHKTPIRGLPMLKSLPFDFLLPCTEGNESQKS